MKSGGNVPSDLQQTLAHHDSAINNLSGRMTNVEGAIGRLDENMKGGFADLSTQLATLNASKPPSMMQQITLASTVLGIMGGVVWGITYIAMSAMQPEIVQLKNAQTFNARSVERRDADEREELKEFRKAERDGLKQQIDDIKHRIGWMSRTSVTAPKKP